MWAGHNPCHIADRIIYYLSELVRYLGKMTMRHSLYAFTALTTFLATSPAIAEDFEVSAPISAVKVHRNYGAIVSREVTLELPAGQHRLFVSGLTSQLDQRYGIRTGIKTGDAIVTGTVIDEKFTPAKAREAQKQLLDQIAALKQQQKADDTAIESINLQLRFVESMASAAANNTNDLSDPAAKLQALRNSFEFVKSTSSSLLAEKAATERRQQTRKEQIDALQRELEQTGGAAKSTKQGVINVSAATAGQIKVTLSYLVRDAGWDIETQANLDTSDEQTTIRLFAKVNQSSGEDWTHVPLSLSTTQPSFNIAYTAPPPIYMNLHDPRQFMAVEQRKANKVMADMQLEPEPITVTGSRIANYSRNQFDAEFSIKNPASIPADGSVQTFLVDTISNDTETLLRISPNWQREAFLYADGQFKDLPVIQNPQAFLTRDGTFVGSGRWPSLGTQAELQLPFGVDNQIDIEVITIPSEDGDTGIFNKRRVEETKQQFLITNNHSKPMTIEVFDTLPNSMNEDLKVEILRGATRISETDVNGQPGVVMWRKEIAAGETWEINHWYKISYPESKNLTRQ